MGIKLSVVIITFNEEDNIERCLESIQMVADEIIVVDSFSTDRTEEICGKFTLNFETHKFEGHKEQKNYALSRASEDAILSLDADEALSPELTESILKVKNNFSKDGYELNRKTNYQGKWINHSGWYPDRKLRLVKKGTATWLGQNPHDKLELNTKRNSGFLSGDLLHYSFKDLTDHVSKTNSYSTIAAREAIKKGTKHSAIRVVANPIFTFVKKFFFQLGFLDGYNGFLIASMGAYGKFLKYSKLREMENQK